MHLEICVLSLSRFLRSPMEWASQLTRSQNMCTSCTMYCDSDMSKANRSVASLCNKRVCKIWGKTHKHCMQQKRHCNWFEPNALHEFVHVGQPKNRNVHCNCQQSLRAAINCRQANMLVVHFLYGYSWKQALPQSDALQSILWSSSSYSRELKSFSTGSFHFDWTRMRRNGNFSRTTARIHVGLKQWG